MSSHQQRTIEANGLRFDALAAGPTGGELVLLLHGFPQFADSWTPILHALADAGYHAVAVNQRGYSPGARPREVKAYALQNLVSDALTFAESLGHQRFHLVGHDWGGLVAWQLAADHPDRLKTLTVLATPHTGAFLRAVKHDPDQRRRSLYIPLFRFPFHLAELLLLARDAKPLRKAWRGKLTPEMIEANLTRLRDGGTLTAALNWYRALSLKAKTGPITVPTLYIWGAKDVALGPSAAHATGNYVQAPYRFEILPNASHWLLEDSHERIAGLLLEHLKDHLKTPA